MYLIIFPGFGAYNILHMLMTGMILMGMIMQSLAMGYVLPAAQCDLELTLKQRGWLSAIPFLGWFLFFFILGPKQTNIPKEYETLKEWYD